jgi:hypothetical protein
MRIINLETGIGQTEGRILPTVPSPDPNRGFDLAGSSLSLGPAALDLLHREKATEKRPIAPQCKSEILGGDIIAAIPLALEFRSFSREHFS